MEGKCSFASLQNLWIKLIVLLKNQTKATFKAKDELKTDKKTENAKL